MAFLRILRAALTPVEPRSRPALQINLEARRRAAYERRGGNFQWR